MDRKDGTLSQLQGVPLPERIVKHWPRVKKFQASTEDLLIATYPKAGTTWTQEVVDQIFNKGDEEKCKRAPTHVRMPFLEMTAADGSNAGISKLEVMDPPRVIKTHLPIQLVPHSFWEAGCKVIYMARNPKDNAVSYYHFDRMNLSQPEPGPWPQYLEKFMTGKLAWGSWYEHVKGYWRERQNKTILYLFFEDMKEDPVREVSRIAEFLGQQISKSTIDHIVQMTTFSAMRDNPMANYSTIPETIFDRTVSEFMRKGMLSFISWFVPSVPTWLIPGAIPFHSVLQGLVGACGILVLRNLLKVYMFIDAQSTADSVTDPKKNNRPDGGLTEKIQFWILTAVLTIVGSRVASLVVLEFSLRAISARITGGSDPLSNSLLRQLVQCQFSLGCALSCSLNFLHEGAPQGWLSLLLAVGLSWFLANQCCKLWKHVKTMYNIHSTQRYCGLCIGLSTTGMSILTWLCNALILTFSVSGIAAVSNINQHFISTTEALRFWTPLTICYTLLVVYMNDDRHQQPGQQVLLNTVVVRLGGLLVLLITVGMWSDVLHVLICFIGEAACLLTSQDLLEDIHQHLTHVPKRSLRRPENQSGQKKWDKFD